MSNGNYNGQIVMDFSHGAEWASDQEALTHFRMETSGVRFSTEPVNHHPNTFAARVIVGGSLKILDWDLGFAAAVFEGRVERTINRLTS